MESSHNTNTALALEIVDEVFSELGIARWWENGLVSVTMDTPHFVQVAISNPTITERSLIIRATDFGLTVDIMSWDEAFEWPVQDYTHKRAGIIDVLKAVLAEPMEITRYGESLAVLRFHRDGLVRYRRRILSGLCVSPLRQSSRNNGPIVTGAKPPR